MNTLFRLRLLLAGLVIALGTAPLFAQNNSTPLDPVLADAGSARINLNETASQQNTSRVPESPVGLARTAGAVLKGDMVATIVVTGITGVEQRLWVPDGMALYEESVEIVDANNDGLPEVIASGVREGRVGRCTWSYRPALERYTSRAQIEFETDENRGISDE